MRRIRLSELQPTTERSVLLLPPSISQQIADKQKGKVEPKNEKKNVKKRQRRLTAYSPLQKQ
jgi:hypothetical protein